MRGSMVDIQRAAAEIRRGKTRKIDRKKPQDENIIIIITIARNITTENFYRKTFICSIVILLFVYSTKTVASTLVTRITRAIFKP